MASSKKLIYKFCPMCSTEMVSKVSNDEASQVCPKCKFEFWNNPKPVASIIVHEAGKVLLLRRANEPLKGAWCLPGGFIQWGEEAAEAVIRECKEETGLVPDVCSVVGAYNIDNDPRGMHIDIIFEGKAKGSIVLSEEHDDYKFFEVNELPSVIAYKHREAIGNWRSGT